MLEHNSKILILDNSLKSFVGFRGRLLSELRRNSQVEIASLIDLTADELPQNVKLHDVRIERGSLSLPKIIKELFRMLSILNRSRPTIFLSFTIRCAFISGLSKFFYQKSKNIVVIAGLGHIFQSAHFGHQLIQKMLIYVISQNDKVIVLNKEIFKTFAKCNPILIEGEGVDLQKFRYSQKKTINHFIFVGRLLRDKGVLELIEAFNIARKKYHGITLKLILSIDDENPERIDLSLLNSSINDSIQIIKDCENVYDQLQEADCFIFPSYHEGFSIALSEAAAVGLILIASDIEGCRQIVTPRNGFLVEPKSAKSISEAIDKVMTLNADKVANMSFESRTLAEHKLDQELQSKAFFNEIL